MAPTGPDPVSAPAQTAPDFKAADLQPARTEAGKKYVTESPFDPTDAAAFGTLMTAKELVAPGTDSTSISNEELLAFGINPETHIAYRCRNPQYWENNEKKDRVAEFLRAAPGRIVARDANGDLVTEADTVLCAFSRAEKEWCDKQAALERTSDMALGQSGHIPQAEAFTEGPSRVMATNAHQQHREDGTIGPTRGREYKDVIAERVRRHGADDIEREQRQWAGIENQPRRGYNTREEFERAEAEKGTNKKSFAMGATIKNGKVEK